MIKEQGDLSETEEPDETSETERRGVSQSPCVQQARLLYYRRLSWAPLNHVRGTQIHLVEKRSPQSVSIQDKQTTGGQTDAN